MLRYDATLLCHDAMLRYDATAPCFATMLRNDAALRYYATLLHYSDTLRCDATQNFLSARAKRALMTFQQRYALACLARYATLRSDPLR